MAGYTRSVPGNDKQGKPGLRKVTRSLSLDLATFGWTGHPGYKCLTRGRS
jgi:hypothetical protein